MDKVAFLKKYNIKEEKFNMTNLQWEKLMEIYDDFKSIAQELELAADFISNCLKKVELVHSVRQRIKEPEHLIEKIIRKKLENPDREVTLENYTEEITDLIGIRAIHLFKEDWESIHDYITKTWKTAENPKVNIREGDSGSLIDSYIKRGLEIKEHKYGYRSIHYLIQMNPNRRNYIAEIQVRTIFEEGWSEIDHKIRYPHDMENPILADYLVIFNRLAGSADEMGSFVNSLCNELSNINENHCNELEEKNKLIDELKKTIDELEIEAGKKDKIQKQVDYLQKTLSNYHTVYKSKEDYKKKLYSKILIEAINNKNNDLNKKPIAITIKDNKYCVKRIVTKD